METEKYLNINKETIIKRVYHISGFDCANCANTVESHLNSKEEITSARIDFTANRLYISFNDSPWNIDKLIQIIKEVESDPLEIYEEDKTKKPQDNHEHHSSENHEHHHHHHEHHHHHKHHDHEHNDHDQTFHEHEQLENEPSGYINDGAVKKVYHISGFDCANCATHVEKYLNKKEDISYAKIDFSANKMYISYKKNSWNIEKVKKTIAEVESDPLEIYEEANELQVKNNKKKKEQKIITKTMKIIIGRVIFGFVMTVILVFALGNEKLRWLRFGLYLGTFCVLSYDIFWKVVLHFKTKIKRLDHNLLIMIAGVGSFCLFIFYNIRFNQYREHIIYKIGKNHVVALDEGMDVVLVVVLYQIGHIIESVATNKSKAEVMKTVELRVETANLIKDEKIIVVSPEELEIGNKIVCKIGELIPVDGIVLEGEALIDTSSLTGEFIPEPTKKGKEVYSGCLIKQGQITVEVKKVYADSTVNKILKLITSGGEKKSRADEFVDKFSKYYTPIVVIIAIIAIIIYGSVTGDWAEAICQGLEILVAGCPCSIVISVPLAYFSAIGLSSKNGIIVKGAPYLDKLRDMKKLVMDKTGTITKGTFSIQIIKPVNCTEEELLNNLYIIESLSNHPIAKAIVGEKDLGQIAAKIENYEEKAGLGVSGKYEGKIIYAGTKTFLESFNIQVVKAEEIGTVIYLGINQTFMGYVVLADEIKKSAKEMVKRFHKKKVEIILLTGDREENAKEIATKLNIDRYHSNLLPEQKTKILEEEMQNKAYVVGFVGDGINDAPSIKRSDIGIAMGGIGSDIAVENADIVIMNDDPIKIFYAMKIAKTARNVSIFNIAFSLFIKVAVATLINSQEFIHHFRFPMYCAVIADTGLCVLMVLNSLSILYRKIRIKIKN